MLVFINESLAKLVYCPSIDQLLFKRIREAIHLL
jgi:hypothetical protein